MPAKQALSRTAVLLLCSLAVSGASKTEQLCGTFSGEILCADCAGIHLEITLHCRPSNYELKQTYEGTRHGSETYIEKGTWALRRGSAKNVHAAVYELTPAGSDAKQFYLRVNKNTLHLLDRRRQELPPQLPHTLQRIK